MDILIFSLLTNSIYYCTGRLFISQNASNFNKQFNIYFQGLIIISFIALILNFLTELSQLINSIIYIIILFVFIFKFKNKFNLNDLSFLILSSTITFMLIIFSTVNRPDAGLYHLPFISILNEFKIIIGINNLDFRFGHTSIIQYLSAINNNYLFKDNGISIPLASLVSFFYIYFFYDIWRVIKKKDLPNIGNIFSLFVIIYISFKITRYSSFGNDAIPHLTFFYLISYILKHKLNNLDISKLILLSVFIFINKPNLGVVFIIPASIYFIKKKIIFKEIFKLFFSFPLIFLYVWLIKNILISGCLVFPIKASCIGSLPWTNNEQITNSYIAGQAWSKGWPDRKDKNIKMSDFNKDFNWVKTWSDKHLKYILKIIIPYIIVILSIVIFIKKYLYSHEKKDEDLNKRIFLLTILNFICVLSFFLIFPLYRYGYSFLITFIALIFLNLLKNSIFFKKKINLFKFIFLIAITIISIKQFQRVYDRYNNYDNRWPNIYTLYENKRNDYKNLRIKDNFSYYQVISGDYLCMYLNPPCAKNPMGKNIVHKKILNYSFLISK